MLIEGNGKGRKGEMMTKQRRRGEGNEIKIMYVSKSVTGNEHTIECSGNEVNEVYCSVIYIN